MEELKIILLSIDEKLNKTLQHFKDEKVNKVNKTKQQINKDYYQKLKTTDQEKYEAYLQKMKNRYFKNDKQT